MMRSKLAGKCACASKIKQITLLRVIPTSMQHHSCKVVVVVIVSSSRSNSSSSQAHLCLAAASSLSGPRHLQGAKLLHSYCKDKLSRNILLVGMIMSMDEGSLDSGYVNLQGNFSRAKIIYALGVFTLINHNQSSHLCVFPIPSCN